MISQMPGREQFLENILDRLSAQLQPRKSKILNSSGNPIIYPDNIEFRRVAAKQTGSMRKWNPIRLGSDILSASDREMIVSRAVDLSQNDPNAAGVVDQFASTVIGTGLKPHPILSAKTLNLSDDQISEIENRQKEIYENWNPFADAAGKMSFNQIQFLAQRMTVEYGEYLFLLPMLKDESRPYSLALQAINPLRLKTPRDLSRDPNIKDGIELGRYGEPVAYWIKKSESNFNRISDLSTNFLRIPAKAGHRFKVLHGFPILEPEQVRGVSFFAPAMKFFRDLADYLDAELVSAIVTAAFAVFIETGSLDPLGSAQAMATINDTGYKSDSSEYENRYEEIEPGGVYYGNSGEKPHLLEAERPGRTFEPFIKSILKSISNSLGIPYPVLFRDFDGMNYASYRSAMLEAWRVFKSRRQWLGEKLCQPVYQMLIEESYLRGEIELDQFYKNYWNYTKCQWIGPSKGQIEPIKEVQAEILAINNRLKSREESMLEQGRDFKSTMDQILKEKNYMSEKGIEVDEQPGEGSTQPENISVDNQDEV